MGTLSRNLTTIGLAGILATGCIFSSLEEDLDRLDDIAHLFSGVVTSNSVANNAIVVVALQERNPDSIESYRMMPGAGAFEIRARARPTRFFAFADKNRDLTYQTSEPFGWANRGNPIDPAAGSTEDIRIEIGIGQTDVPDFPAALVNQPLDDHLNNYVRPAIGEVTPLDSPLFSRERAEQGLWTPFAFVEDGGAGIHFLKPYDPDHVPILFVHGINATPRDFTAMIDALDTTKYQAWVLSYPSGLRLSWVARGMYQFLDSLHRQYSFDELHVVAHSMGGLVSRGAINLCTQNDSCDFLATFTSVSTPWNGVESAVNGVKWAPTAVPVWHDLDPGSEYITTLFDTGLPDVLVYHLIFGYRHDNMFGAESSDGVIKLTSQLRHDAQLGAETVRGFDEGHVSILDNQIVIEKIYTAIDDGSDR